MLRDRRVQRGGERQAQHVAGLAGIDDAVVPQPRRGVIGIALVLVLLADRRLEGFLLFRRPVSPRVQRVALTVASTLAACSPPITLMRRSAR